MTTFGSVTVRNRVYYPEDLNVYCPAAPVRRGLLAVSRGGDLYEMYKLKSSKAYELTFPKDGEDSWISTCVQQYIGPDLIMISDHCFTTYIRLA